ncbi:MAG: hypothetical protein CMF67_04255 [Magnetovibrio sp.]|nr:hypothetical protein [Magnetovibrio sp.]
MRPITFLKPVVAGFALMLAASSFVHAKDPIPVVSTFSILGDLVKQVGGNHIALTTLVGHDGDAHVYKPTPADARAVSAAKVLFVNGLEFEGWIDRLVDASDFRGSRIVATEGIAAIPFEEADEHGNDSHKDDDHAKHKDDDHDKHKSEGGHEFEWAGVFELSPGTYKWSFAKVDGKYADPGMKMVILKSDGIETAEEKAEGLLKSEDLVSRDHNDVLVAQDKAYALNFDATKDMTVFSVNIDKAGKYAFFTGHMPFEFEANEHFFKNVTGKDVEPVEQEPEAGHHHHHGAFDPHAWQSAENVVTYITNIAAALVKADPANTTAYIKNRDAYVAKLRALDADIMARMNALPENKRTVVTSHDAFGYFAKRYGLKFEAPQGMSTESEASAKDVATLINQIRKEKISAVFVETITDNRLMEQISRETGAKIGGTLYSDALSGPKGPASTYLDMMRHNALAISKSLGS